MNKRAGVNELLKLLERKYEGARETMQENPELGSRLAGGALGTLTGGLLGAGTSLGLDELSTLRPQTVAKGGSLLSKLMAIVPKLRANRLAMIGVPAVIGGAVGALRTKSAQTANAATISPEERMLQDVQGQRLHAGMSQLGRLNPVGTNMPPAVARQTAQRFANTASRYPGFERATGIAAGQVFPNDTAVTNRAPEPSFGTKLRNDVRSAGNWFQNTVRPRIAGLFKRNEAYTLGFMDKCAVYNLKASALIKYAQTAYGSYETAPGGGYYRVGQQPSVQATNNQQQRTKNKRVVQQPGTNTASKVNIATNLPPMEAINPPTPGAKPAPVLPPANASTGSIGQATTGSMAAQMPPDAVQAARRRQEQAKRVEQQIPGI